MTATDYASAPRASARGSRTLNVVRLQFINRQTFIWVPLLVFGGAWLLSVLIYWIIAGSGVEGVKVGGASQAPLWYYSFVGIQAMNLTFPFSQAMSLTRREFFLGSLAAAAVSALGMSLLFVMIGGIEQVTGGYGINGYFARLDWIWEHGALGAALTYFTLTMLFFVVGFWFATVYKRFGPLMLATAIIAISLALVGLIALITFRHAWTEVGTWLVETGAVGLTPYLLVLTALLAGASYLTLRKMPA